MLQTGSQGGEKPNPRLWELGWNYGGIRDFLGQLSQLDGLAFRDSKGQRGSGWFHGKSWLSPCHHEAREMITALDYF